MSKKDSEPTSEPIDPTDNATSDAADAPQNADGAAKASAPGAYESFDAEAVAAEEAALDAAEAEDAPETAPADADDAAAAMEAEPAVEEPVREDDSEADETVADLEAELAAVKDQLLRSMADFQNLRRRADKERKDAETYGGAKLARDMLSVHDNLAAALSQASDTVRQNEAPFMNGLELTRKELLNVFGKHGIQPIEPQIGERFDPNRHQAMYEQPTDEVEPGAVVNVMQSGFMIGERLLRPAMVGVAKAKEAASG